MTTNYVICAAGEGTRFRGALGDLPKPLIRLHGATLLEWSLRALPIFEDDRVVIIAQSRHGLRGRLHDVVRDRYPLHAIEWVELPAATGGQLETVLAAEPHLAPDAPLVVYNSDTFFRSRTLLGAMAQEEVEGIIPCSQEPGDAWSFCRVDAHDRVLQVEEKVRISPWASVGFYFFRDLPCFLDRARTAVARGKGEELYVAPLYQRYLEGGEVVVMDRVTDFRPMGTPEQIEGYWGISMDRVRAWNVSPACSDSPPGEREPPP